MGKDFFTLLLSHFNHKGNKLRLYLR